MSASTATPVRVVTHWRRFQSGLWGLSKGDINAAYSASSFPKIRVFAHAGKKFTNCGAAFSKWIHTEVRAYPLIPAELYDGLDSVPYSYAGHEANHKGTAFRLGPEVVFISSEPTVEEWRNLLRVFFAHGGPYSGGDYGAFLTGRCVPDSENGPVAARLELADFAGGKLPQAKDTMLEWLAAGAKSSSLPTKQLAFQL